MRRLSILENWVQGDLQPDLTLFIDVPVPIALERLNRVQRRDRFEQEQTAFFERVSAAYRRRVEAFPGRIRQVKGDQPINTIQVELERILATVC
jgi:dTMP kinase